MENDQISEKSINTKIIITAIMSVLLGAAFVLALIGFGMNMQRNFDNENAERRSREKVVSIVHIKYTTADFSYTPGEGASDRALLDRLDAKSDNYYLVNSNDKLTAVMDAVNDLSAGGNSYTVDEGFFESSSLVAVPVEAAALSDVKIKSVTRDEDYNVQIDVQTETKAESADVAGRVVLVKLDNIQPKVVTVNVN